MTAEGTEDIVARLRDQCCRLGHDDHGHTNCWLFGRAAAEIERLREENTGRRSVPETVWRDPPPLTYWADRLQPLRERPQVWARFGPYSTSTIHGTARYLRDRHDGFEFRAATQDGAGWVFARYIKDAHSPSEEGTTR